ncbi:MAG: HD domain-containing protein [Nanoarchaeota archaeon]|nr:HD domain-containing protein [Nanoarchaeota archaeon]
MKKEELSNILTLILNNKPFTEMSFGIHGRPHACKVLLLANMLTNLMKNREKINLTAVTISALLHDCGRSSDGNDHFHSIKSAEKTLEFIQKKKIKCNTKLIKECIIRHCPPPDYINHTPSIESKIVGDADKLDRFRFLRQKQPCNVDLLEMPESKILMDVASRVNGHNWRSFKN